MKLSYKKRILFCFLLIFAVFAICIIVIEQKQEKQYRTEALETRLNDYADLIHEYIIANDLDDSTIYQLHQLIAILPEDIRITVVDTDGGVSFDKEAEGTNKFDNHLNRPEILQAQYQPYGSHVRMSASTHIEYIYYAKRYPTCFVRVALPYDIQTQNLLKADNLFIYIVIALFIGVLILLNYVSSRFGKSISELKAFTSLIKQDKALPQGIKFPDDELGEIGEELVDIFDQKEKSKQALEREKEKLIRHFRFLEEGFCVFSSDSKEVYHNTHFVQYLNLISDKPVLDANAMLRDETFSPILEFVGNTKRSNNHFAYKLNKNGKTFSVQTVIYKDQSFEVTIKDITEAEKIFLVKQEMTSNIAHELRTPITSIRGYLETLNENSLPVEKQKLFVERAYLQSIRLSNLIEDVSMLSKIEEPNSVFIFEKINLLQLVNEVRIDLADKLTQNNIRLLPFIAPTVLVDGNHTLLYSIFRNLIDNSICYAGKDTEIHINCYTEDEKYVYLSYYDTGKGVAEQHINRLFERFYRICEGRTRDTGGSGLGLSIVRNAVLMHKGKIEAKNKINAGLEFLFTLHK